MPPFRKLLGAVSGVLLSATSLAALAYVGSEPMEVELPTAPEPAPHVAAGGGALPARPAPNVEPSPAQVDPGPAEEPPSGPAVPELTNARLSNARRQARELGLRVAARDEFGARIGPDFARFYRVVRQVTPVGAVLPPGAAIEVRVAEIAQMADGY